MPQDDSVNDNEEEEEEQGGTNPEESAIEDILIITTFFVTHTEVEAYLLSFLMIWLQYTSGMDLDDGCPQHIDINKAARKSTRFDPDDSFWNMDEGTIREDDTGLTPAFVSHASSVVLCP